MCFMHNTFLKLKSFLLCPCPFILILSSVVQDWQIGWLWESRGHLRFRPEMPDLGNGAGFYSRDKLQNWRYQLSAERAVPQRHWCILWQCRRSHQRCCYITGTVLTVCAAFLQRFFFFFGSISEGRFCVKVQFSCCVDESRWSCDPVRPNLTVQ